MRLLFLDNGTKTTYGSQRIYIKNLMQWARELGHEVSYNKTNYDAYDIILCDKGYSGSVHSIREIKKSSDAIVGIANNTTSIITEYDFCIAACQTEWVHSVQFNKNVLRFPLIEILDGYKEHNNVDQITICYHGNKEHLEQMSPSILSSLEALSKNYRIKLKAIYNIGELGIWKHNRPEIEIDDVQWDFDQLAPQILECDIGLVPANSPINNFEKKCFISFQNLFHKMKPGNSNDHLIRFKACSNAGRAFVFHQLGLPVVSEIYPDAYHILQSHNTGYIAGNFNSWFIALEQLCCDYVHRQEVADNAKVEFDRLYNPLIHARKLISEIEDLKSKNANSIL